MGEASVENQDTALLPGLGIAQAERPAFTEGDLFDDRYELTSITKAGHCALGAFARDTETDSRVFIKAVDASNIDIAMRFNREVGVMRKLDHPQIPKVHESNVNNKLDYAVLEPMGGNRYIEEWLKAYPSPKLAARICSSALTPLGYMHKEGVAHRDIKPSNLVMSWSGEVALTDFEGAVPWDRNEYGESQNTLIERGATLTNTGRLFGTPAYLSPEQAHADTFDERTDIYSMGSTFYKLLYGHHPLEFPSTPMSAARMHEYVLLQYTLPSSVLFNLFDTRGRDIPSPLVDVIRKATKKWPEDRYQSADEMQEDLEAYITDAE